MPTEDGSSNPCVLVNLAVFGCTSSHALLERRVPYVHWTHLCQAPGYILHARTSLSWSDRVEASILVKSFLVEFTRFPQRFMFFLCCFDITDAPLLFFEMRHRGNHYLHSVSPVNKNGNKKLISCE